MDAEEYVLHDWTNWGDWHGPWSIVAGIFIVSFVFIIVLLFIRILTQRHYFIERGYHLPQYNVDPKYRAACTGENEEFKACGACDSTCDGPRACPLICAVNGGCGCKQGYVRGPPGKCILESQCAYSQSAIIPSRNFTDPTFLQVQKCGPGEVWNRCGAVCENTCAFRGLPCIQICGQPSCSCKPGYLRKGLGECVLESECP